MFGQKFFTVRLRPIGARGRAKVAAVFGIIDWPVAHAIERQPHVIEVDCILGRLVTGNQEIVRVGMNELLSPSISAVLTVREAIIERAISLSAATVGVSGLV